MMNPRWLTELSLSLASNPQVVLTGNVRDVHVLPDVAWFPRTADAVTTELARRGYQLIFLHHPVEGLRCRAAPEARDEALTLLNGLQDSRRGHVVALVKDEKAPPVPTSDARTILPQLMEVVVASSRIPAALVIDYASWITPASERGTTGSDQTTESLDALRRATTLCASAFPMACGREVPLYNPVIWIVRQQNELPTWLLSAPGMRIVSIEEPGQDTRRAYGEKTLASWPEFVGLCELERGRALDLFVAITEGFTLKESGAIINLGRDRGMTLEELPAAQFAYRVGVVESEWEQPALKARIRVTDEGGTRRDLALAGLRASVQGQDAAVQKASEIVQRAVMGLAGAESSSTNPSRPKGVLFLAGPTGVGKTLLAKAITELVFGRPDNYTRFDMSEYSQEHSEARLVGAPPGYVGYSAGGQLTEAVRKNPFSLLLFDEVEKAHPLILDKFLQILDEGRLTDGSGTTVNFSETIIVFTSNLGVMSLGRDAHGNVVTTERVRYSDRFPAGGVGMSFDEFETGVRSSVRDYFVTEIRRPELLNRIGQGNILVFDFIDRPTAGRILDRAIANVLATVTRKHEVTIRLSPEAEQTVRDLGLTDRTLSMGGRGLNSAVEEFLVNPLARLLAGELDEQGHLRFGVGTITGLTQEPASGRCALTLQAH